MRRAVVERLPTTRNLLRTPAVAKAQSASLSKSLLSRAAAKERAKAAKAEAERAQLGALAEARKTAFEERQVSTVDDLEQHNCETKQVKQNKSSKDCHSPSPPFVPSTAHARKARVVARQDEHVADDDVARRRHGAHQLAALERTGGEAPPPRRRAQGEFSLCTVTFNANLAHSLTRSP